MSDQLARRTGGALLTIPEVAAALRVAEGTVRRYIAAGQLRAIRLGDDDRSPLRIRSADLARFLGVAAERQVERRTRSVQ